MQKDPDCVAWKHRGAEQIREELKGKSREEQLAWWKEQTRKLRELQRQALAQKKRKSA